MLLKSSSPLLSRCSRNKVLQQPTYPQKVKKLPHRFGQSTYSLQASEKAGVQRVSDFYLVSSLWHYRASIGRRDAASCQIARSACTLDTSMTKRSPRLSLSNVLGQCTNMMLKFYARVYSYDPCSVWKFCFRSS